MDNANAYLDADERLELPATYGAAHAFGHILSASLPSFYRMANRLLGNAADAEDAVQDALLAAYTHLDQFRGRSQMSTWLTSILYNSARMQLRKRLRHVHVSLDESGGEGQELAMSEQLADCRPTPEDECRHSELRRRLIHLQTKLSPSLRRTFQLRDIDGLSIKETAKLLGVPHGTVKAQSARARKKLRDLLRRVRRPRSYPLTVSSRLHPQ